MTLSLTLCRYSDTGHASISGVRRGRFNPAGSVRHWWRNVSVGLLRVTRWRLRRSSGRHFVPHRGMSWTERQWRWWRGDSQDGLGHPTWPDLEDIALWVRRRVRMRGRKPSSCVDLSRVTSSRLARFHILLRTCHLVSCVRVQNLFSACPAVRTVTVGTATLISQQLH